MTSLAPGFVSRKLHSLCEFNMEGLKAYGLKDLLNNPESCRTLFVERHVEAVDSNYLEGYGYTNVGRIN